MVLTQTSKNCEISYNKAVVDGTAYKDSPTHQFSLVHRSAVPMNQEQFLPLSLLNKWSV